MKREIRKERDGTTKKEKRVSKRKGEKNTSTPSKYNSDGRISCLYLILLFFFCELL